MIIIYHRQRPAHADRCRCHTHRTCRKSIDYAANNYAKRNHLILAIRDNPKDVASYLTIENIADYDMIVIATPLWWSNMSAPMQSFKMVLTFQQTVK